ncbi:MAG: hypothetical protein K2G37_00650 [Clostridia bacterium]|nr:hypothetical protein [Clostridia bacterium]MDE7329161.1 hypothetical protein [Clostridia bacterium]
MPKIEEANTNFEGIKVACVGDSLTYGTTLLNRKKDCYPARLQKMLGDKFNVLNLGMEGITVSSYSAKYWGQRAMINTLETYMPNYIILLLGTNDARIKNWTDEDVFKKEFTKLINYLKGLSFMPHLLVMTPPNSFKPLEHDDMDFDVELLKKIVDIQRSVLKELNVKYVDIFSMTQNKEHLFSIDKLHLNSKGAKFIAYEAFLHLKNIT